MSIIREMKVKHQSDPFWDLVATAERLLAPGGCAWDRAQTIETLLPYLVEEAWEVYHAAGQKDAEALQEELGDLLYTILFIALKAQDNGYARLPRLLENTRAKMIRRHPHVFGSRKANSPKEAYASWQSIKRQEGKPKVSLSKQLRGLLVQVWKGLAEDPSFRRALRSWLREQKRIGKGDPPLTGGRFPQSRSRKRS